ncbi:hypothetical protein SAMN06296386_101126 [Lachnospiraceae bacterium]|nr:hypothetical protein SAMN06296386_101126 [Lachnospiraceae bacterium]
MNKDILHQIFTRYIERFDYINDSAHEEYYKWQVCHEFPDLMKKALESDSNEFAKALYEVKKATYNIIDSYTQPFSGLVDLAKSEPESVRRILIDLYAGDGGDLKIRMQKISNFFEKYNELLDKYYPDSFLYKQNSHSVSALLFLNDPDNHYMYKATQSRRFADCVEFYDDWGSGDIIDLDIYHRMCDELVSEIKKNKELLDTDASRFDGRLKLPGGQLHLDTEKHILAFDIIYCCSVYDIFDGVSYTKRNAKEKQLYLENKEKAQHLKAIHEKAKAEKDLLEEALMCFTNIISVGDKIHHIKYGEGIIESIDEKYIVADFKQKKAQISLPIGIANGLLKVDMKDYDGYVAKYQDVLKRHTSVRHNLENAARSLKQYEDYLE